MKRIEFVISGENGQALQEPGFVEKCSELPIAVMQAMEDFLDAYDGDAHLPITIQVRRSVGGPSC